jgi:hypothetical protein
MLSSKIVCSLLCLFAFFPICIIDKIIDQPKGSNLLYYVLREPNAITNARFNAMPIIPGYLRPYV